MILGTFCACRFHHFQEFKHQQTSLSRHCVKMNVASCHDACMIASPQAPRPSASARAASAEVGRQEQLRSVRMVCSQITV